jgi:hypothetical protein
MASSASAALSWALFSTGLCAGSAGSVGISVFLLVSVRMGGRSFGATGDRLSQIEDLTFLECCAGSWQGVIYAALPPSRDDVSRRQHIRRDT